MFGGNKEKSSFEKRREENLVAERASRVIAPRCDFIKYALAECRLYECDVAYVARALRNFPPASLSLSLSSPIFFLRRFGRET